MRIELKILNQEFYTELGNDYEPLLKNIPHYATQGSAGIDLVCTEDLVIVPGETAKICTGIAVHMGSGYTRKQLSDVFDVSIMGMIVPRSGLGTKGLVLANTIGIIDEDYQGEILVQAWNRLKPNYMYTNHVVGFKNRLYLRAGDRFAQLIFVPVIKVQFGIVDEFTKKTERSINGFGSTGV